MEMFLEIEVLFAAEGSKNKTDFAFYYFSFKNPQQNKSEICQTFYP